MLYQNSKDAARYWEKTESNAVYVYSEMHSHQNKTYCNSFFKFSLPYSFKPFTSSCNRLTGNVIEDSLTLKKYQKTLKIKLDFRLPYEEIFPKN